jgi:hypothetical protein
VPPGANVLFFQGESIGRNSNEIRGILWPALTPGVRSRVLGTPQVVFAAGGVSVGSCFCTTRHKSGGQGDGVGAQQPDSCAPLDTPPLPEVPWGVLGLHHGVFAQGGAFRDRG